MTYTELAERCRIWRKSRGITLDTIAHCAGVTRQAVHCFETGKAKSMRIYCAYRSFGFEGGLSESESFLIDLYGGGKNGKKERNK